MEGVAKPGKEVGVPKVGLPFKGNDSATVGPFHSPGSYHLSCTIPADMNLTVIVAARPERTLR
jgi:hypothetical protein